MKWSSAVGAILAVAFGPGAARAQPNATGRDLGAEARGVFVTKCAGCHGPDLPKPKGRFGYVLDLRRVAGNPELVIPGRPDESEMWALVSHGDMPPADAPHGPLTSAEKETVRAWIAAGAQDARAVPAEAPNSAPDPESAAAPVPPAPADRLVRFLGKFHLLLLHFPIALLVAAGIGEFGSALRGGREPLPAVQFCLTLAAATAVPTVVFGWLHAASGNGIGSPQLLTAHRWLGTLAGAGAGVAAWCAWRDARRGARSWRGRAALAVALLFVAATAHAGGLIAHGRDFFDW
jgi:mono/diheme cytochrome c family protein